MWLTGRLSPDFKTIADFRKDNGPAIKKVCSHFIGLCREIKLFSEAVVAIDGSKFKAVNNIDSMQERLDRMPEVARLRRQTVEHPYATLKAWMGATHFLTRTFKNVYRDEPACFGLQPETSDADPRIATNNADDESVESSAPISALGISDISEIRCLHATADQYADSKSRFPHSLGWFVTLVAIALASVSGRK